MFTSVQRKHPLVFRGIYKVGCEPRFNDVDLSGNCHMKGSVKIIVRLNASII